MKFDSCSWMRFKAYDHDHDVAIWQHQSLMYWRHKSAADGDKSSVTCQRHLANLTPLIRMNLTCVLIVAMAFSERCYASARPLPSCSVCLSGCLSCSCIISIRVNMKHRATSLRQLCFLYAACWSVQQSVLYAVITFAQMMCYILL